MRTDPPEIYRWRVFALVSSACFGGMLFGWEMGAIGGVLAMTPTKQIFGYADVSSSSNAVLDQKIVSTLQRGAFVACFCTGWLTERFGRKWCLATAGVVTVISVVFQACSTINGTLPVMCVGRFGACLGVGAASSLVPRPNVAPRGGGMDEQAGRHV
ncbi:hypothetical protein ACJZ2D_012639 [Fusarium nematophilum]